MDQRPGHEARLCFLAIGGLLLAGLAVLVSGCHFLPRNAKIPIPSRSWKSSESSAANTLIVFLPGRNGSLDDFESHGFFEELHRAGVKADLVAVDAHLGYYYKRTIIDRLREDVLAPAKAQGYRRIVVVGISMGGLGALLCDRDLHGTVDALVLLSPYAGDSQTVFKEIATSGGPAAWAKGRELRSGEINKEIWTFLGQRSAQLPPTWLYFGTADSLAQGQRLLASLLPSARVEIVEGGGHNWTTWKKVWRDACESPELFREEKK